VVCTRPVDCATPRRQLPRRARAQTEGWSHPWR
jgi:hypothetical protein